MKNKKKFVVQIGSHTFYVSLFCFKRVGDTENMKFRLECEQNSDLNRDFDDFESLKEYLNSFMQKELFNYALLTV